MMLMTLGVFVFTINTASFNVLQRQTAQRWTKSDPVGRAPAYQNLGEGDDTITLNGQIADELLDMPVDPMSVLRIMQSSGKTWALVTGQGAVLGFWFIDSVEETQRHLGLNGKPRLIDFTLSIKKDAAIDLSAIGDLDIVIRALGLV